MTAASRPVLEVVTASTPTRPGRAGVRRLVYRRGNRARDLRSGRRGSRCRCAALPARAAPSQARPLRPQAHETVERDRCARGRVRLRHSRVQLRLRRHRRRHPGYSAAEAGSDHAAHGPGLRGGQHTVRGGDCWLSHAIQMAAIAQVRHGEGRYSLQVRNGRNSSRTKTFDAAEGEIVAFRCSGKSILPIFSCPSSFPVGHSRSTASRRVAAYPGFGDRVRAAASPGAAGDRTGGAEGE